MLASILFFFFISTADWLTKVVRYFSANHKTLLLSGQQHIKEVTIWGAQVSNLLFNLICFSDLALMSSFANHLAWISI